MRTLVAAMLVVLAQGAVAQTFPAKPVRVVVGYPPGGGMDAIARIVGARLGADAAQQFVIDNRPGAGATLAGDTVAKAPPDGYTVLLAETGFLVAPAMFPKLPFDPLKSFATVGGVATLPLAIVTPPQFTAKTPAELIALLKANPGKYSYGSAGVGSLQHLAMELFRRQAGVEVVHIPYKGAAPMMPDLMSGQLPIGVISVAPAIAQARAGKLHAVAITVRDRLALMPDTPTVAETFSGFDAAPRVFLLAPLGTPENVIGRLNELLRVALGSAEVREGLAKQGATPQWSGPKDLATDMESESRKWIGIARDAGVKGE